MTSEIIKICIKMEDDDFLVMHYLSSNTPLSELYIDVAFKLGLDVRSFVLLFHGNPLSPSTRMYDCPKDLLNMKTYVHFAPCYSEVNVLAPILLASNSMRSGLIPQLVNMC